jgi:ribonuclease Y
MLEIIIAVAATLVVAIPVTAAVTNNYRKRVTESKIGNAEQKAREIIDEALKVSETKKREALLEVK